jgi:hypothetical protein
VTSILSSQLRVKFRTGHFTLFAACASRENATLKEVYLDIVIHRSGLRKVKKSPSILFGPLMGKTFDNFSLRLNGNEMEDTFLQARFGIISTNTLNARAQDDGVVDHDAQDGFQIINGDGEGMYGGILFR